ncbi:MAG: lysine--tRNA ligase [Candidatus Ratteibacteria bacterium]|nr:lysine--tRNA ligase [Candidatus Ratteibacteria bacterium]
MADKEKVSSQVEERIKKLEVLEGQGIDPYGQRFLRTGSIKKLREKFDSLKDEQIDKAEVQIAGRLMLIRGHGKAVFADLHDSSGKIQLYLKLDVLGQAQFEVSRLIERGDIIGVKGPLFKTRTGELTVKVEKLTVLAKALRPLPEKWHGLRDIEVRYRERYVDLIVNPKVKEIFLKRSRIITLIREFLNQKGYLEVETPMMQPIPGGAKAEPFATYHKALDTELFLRIAPELYLKRLLVGGFEKVYEINRSFRNEGLSTRHNPEFTMLEVYAAYGDYRLMMDLTESLINFLAEKTSGSSEISSGDKSINLSPPWKRVDFITAIKEKVKIDFNEITTLEKSKEAAGELDLNLTGEETRAEIMVSIFDKFVQPKLIEPTFVTDYPLELTPLAKAKRERQELAERFELFINGQELANAYTELNDSRKQKARLLSQLKKQAGKKKKLDEDFLKALEYGMPPAGGLGIGIDRLVMLLTGCSSIREVILFPQLRPEK